MTWFKVDDTLHAHKKAMRAGTEAIGLWVLAGSWASDQLTDGWVPQYAIARWSPRADELAERLVHAGLWEPDVHDGDDGWWFHEWDERQPTRADVTAKRKADAERRAKWREDRRKKSLSDSLSDGSRSDADSDSLSDARGAAGGRTEESRRDSRDARSEQRESPSEGGGNGQMSLRDSRGASQQGSVLPDPTRPDPVLPTEEPTTGRRGRKRPAAPLPADWQPNDGHAQQARQLAVNLAFQAEQFRNHAEANDRRQVRWDAAFRQWLNNAPRFTNRSPQGQTQFGNAGDWQMLKTGTHDHRGAESNVRALPIGGTHADS